MAPGGLATSAAHSAAPPLLVSLAWTGNLGEQDFPDALASHNAENTAPPDGEGHPEYIAYFLIPIFFVMGLLGILICHILKKKGYRCTTEAEQEEEKLGEKIDLNETTNDNGDTVGKIVDYIMKNEANADVLKAMVADNSVYDPESPTTPGSPTSPASPLSPGGTQSKHNCRGHHLHTVGGVAGTGGCSRCNQKRWHLFSPAKKAKEARRARHGEVTVLSVGRFRVTKVEHKSASKERKNLVSVSSMEGAHGEMPATPVKEISKEMPVTPVVKQGSKELQDTLATKEARERSGTE
ncbi:RELT-like protein 1 [Hemicordylus capensis]|uniref:RELT-like protein 1 n=1 Tax=Hemicordylus capensis TaxID=884348 RepID=UPI0023044115|nr:RELT-like protein 1 [Hemicordylus capensis]